MNQELNPQQRTRELAKLLEQAERKSDIMTETSERKIKLSITDSGIGIPKENLSRLFQPFFTTKGVKSSGLGLSSSYGLIKKHHGEITVKSLPLQGTTFTIMLPRAEVPADKKHHAQPSKQDMTGSKIKNRIGDVLFKDTY